MIAAPVFRRGVGLMAGALLAALPAASRGQIPPGAAQGRHLHGPERPRDPVRRRSRQGRLHPGRQGRRRRPRRAAGGPAAPVQELVYASGGTTLKYAAVGKLVGRQDHRRLRPWLGRQSHPGHRRELVRRQSRPTEDAGRAERRRLSLAGLLRLRRQGRRGSRGADAEYAANARRARGSSLVCISFGGKLCWRLAENAQAAQLLGGVLILGAPVDGGFLGVEPRCRPCGARAGLSRPGHQGQLRQLEIARRLLHQGQGDHPRLPDQTDALRRRRARHRDPPDRLARRDQLDARRRRRPRQPPPPPASATPPCPRLDPRTHPATRAVC